MTTTTQETRVGWRYNTSNGDGPDHEVVSDTSDITGCVTVKNGAGQLFPVERSLIDMFAAPPGMTWNSDAQRYISDAQNASRP
jgi:hypothetical protein